MKFYFFYFFGFFALSSFAQKTPTLYPNTELAPFFEGVASGDPTDNAVIIWTKVEPNNIEDTVNVTWEMASDINFVNILQSGVQATDSSRFFTVKVDVKNLPENQWFFYRFSAFGKQSIVGRTRTFPNTGFDELRFGHITCTNFHDGYFHALGYLADRNDLDFIAHSGDFIYESSGNSGLPERITNPNKRIYTKNEYRERYRQYRRDPDMLRLSQLYPFLLTWDDHEVADDAYVDFSANHEDEILLYASRKQGAQEVYSEMQPIRLPERNKPSKIYRKHQWGQLVNWYILDTRHFGRDKQADAMQGFTIFSAETTDTNRSILGFEQENWLLNDIELTASLFEWNVMQQQVMFSPWNLGGLPNILFEIPPFNGFFREGGNALNPDQWDGYTASRDRVFRAFDNSTYKNLVVLSSDVHTSFAMDITDDPSNPLVYNPITGNGSKGVEFVTPAVSSGGDIDQLPEAAFRLLEVLNLVANPHMRYNELRHQGYMVHQVDKEKWHSDLYFIDNNQIEETTQSYATSFETQNGENHLISSSDAIVEDQGPDRPDETPLVTGILKQSTVAHWVNIAKKADAITISSKELNNVTLQLFMLNGKKIQDENVELPYTLAKKYSQAIILFVLDKNTGRHYSEKIILD